MREIKFRAWLKEKKEMIDNARPDFFCKQLHYLRDNIAGGQDVLGVSTEDIELMEYTGLKDMREKEIYEGDILLSSDENGIFLISIDFGYPNIEYSNMLTGFQIKTEIILSNSQYFEYFSNNLIELISKYNIPMKEDNNTKYISDGWWILGNIYENPELIKEVR